MDMTKTNDSVGVNNDAGELQRQIDSLSARLNESAEQVDKLSEQLEDLQCRNMRENLLFFGLAERRDRSAEDCIDLIDQFCGNELLLNYSAIPYIDRAHRVGRYASGKIRPIVVKFNDFKVREAVRTRSHYLHNTSLWHSGTVPKRSKRSSQGTSTRYDGS